MGQIQRLNRGRVKPYNSVPRIDWSDPITAGLATYCYDIGGSIVDLVNGGHSTQVGASGSQQSQFGRGLQFPLTGYAYMPPFLPGRIKPFGGAAPFSGAIGTIFNSTPLGPGAGPDAACVLVQDAGNTEDSFFGFNTWPAGAAGNPAGAHDTLACEVGNTTNSFFTPAVIIVPNTFQSWGMSAPNSTTGLNYFNGVFNNTFSGAVTFNSDTTGQVMYNTASINSGQTFGNGISGQIPYFAMWGRVLSPVEWLRLHLDPWSFLIYPEEEMLAPAVGVAIGGGSVGTAAGSGAATGVGTSSAASTASAAGHGAATGIGAGAAVAAGSAAGTGTATGIGAAIAASLGSASGTGIATGIAASMATSIGSASGVGAASGIGKSTATAVGIAGGVGTAAAVALGAGSIGAASGAGTATGVGASIATSVGLVAGVGTATGIAASAAASVGSSSGTGAATATGASTAKSVGSSSGAGTAAAISASIAAAIGSAFGTGTTAATAASGAPTGLASGIGAATGVGASIVAAVGTSMGFGSASGAIFTSVIVQLSPARWILNISATDDDTDEDIDFTGAQVALAIDDHNGCQKLSATIGNGLTLTSPTTLQLRVTPDQWATMCPGQYQIGAVYQLGGVTYQIFTGQLAVQNDVATLV